MYNGLRGYCASIPKSFDIFTSVSTRFKEATHGISLQRILHDYAEVKKCKTADLNKIFYRMLSFVFRSRTKSLIRK